MEHNEEQELVFRLVIVQVHAMVQALNTDHVARLALLVDGARSDRGVFAQRGLVVELNRELGFV